MNLEARLHWISFRFMAKHHRNDPCPAFNFVVEMDGLVQAGVTGVIGLNGALTVVEYREGGDELVRKLPGLAKYSNIMLRRRPARLARRRRADPFGHHREICRLLLED
jgi:hypothetical protein